MTAAAADRNTPRRDGKQYEGTIAASVTIYKGTIACLDTSGNVRPGRASTTDRCVGVFTSSTAEDAVKARYERGVFRFANSSSTDAITAAEIGANCYVVDNQTVAKTDGSTTRIVAGVVRDVDAQGVWVEI